KSLAPALTVTRDMVITRASTSERNFFIRISPPLKDLQRAFEVQSPDRLHMRRGVSSRCSGPERTTEVPFCAFTLPQENAAVYDLPGFVKKVK
ncbi:hypothetical protein, partial [Dysosmobacter welbionis]|uniref:hypothetical protein n=1 Tax=Dysosmobacter welbionis TaxID=2093857 RepID=UPI0030797025